MALGCLATAALSWPPAWVPTEQEPRTLMAESSHDEAVAFILPRRSVFVALYGEKLKSIPSNIWNN